jgi:hypothetical protein
VRRSIQEILDHADELAAKFEDYEPSADDEVDVTVHLLRRAALNRARSERQVAEAVAAARAAGLSWKQDRRADRHVRTGRTTALRLSGNLDLIG